MSREHVRSSSTDRSHLHLSSDDNKYREDIYCYKPDPSAESHLPYHARTRSCDEQAAYRARDRYMNSDQIPIEKGSPYISKDPQTGKTIVIYKDPSISDEAIYEEYNHDKQYMQDNYLAEFQAEARQLFSADGWRSQFPSFTRI